MAITSKRQAASKSAAQINAEATASPAPVVAAEGTAVPQTVVETPPQAEPEKAAENQAPIVVKTAEQLAAESLYTAISAAFETWYHARPQTAVWVEPTEDQRNERIAALMGERGIKPTDFLKIGLIAGEIETQIAGERAASGIDQQTALDIAYLRAAQGSLMGLHTTLGIMLEKLGAKPTTKTRAHSSTSASAPRASSSSSSWKEKNPKLIAYAKSLGLPDLVLVDTASNGYKGEFHVVAACDDGTWEDCEYNPTTMAYKRTGVKHDKPFYWKTPDIKYDVAQMYNVLMGQVVVEGVNIVVGKGENLKTKPFADLALFSKAAGI